MSRRKSKGPDVVEMPMSAWQLLPAKAGTCPECASKHSPEAPHNWQSIYWLVRFKIKNGRDPTKEDAFAHCSEEMKTEWAVTEKMMREEGRI